MHRLKLAVSLTLLAGSAALTSCGGGGFSPGPPPPPPPDLGTAEGLWKGTTGDGRTFTGLVLDDGTYWFIYTAVGNNTVLDGAVQGSSTSTGGKFNSTNGIDFNFAGLGINAFTLSGTYTANSKLSGTLTYTPSGTKTFTSNYDTDYDLTPSLTAIIGTYTGEALAVGSTVQPATVTIASGGALTGSSAGCTFTGSATPRPSGNVYNVSVTFAGGVCVNGSGTVTGVAYYDAVSKELVSTALNSARSNGFIFLGTRP